MENGSNRIGSLALTPTVARQTPRNDFGMVLARTAQEVARIGSGLVGMIPGGPVVSAAVSGVRSTLAVAALAGGASTRSGELGGSPGQGDAWELLEAQRLMNMEGQRFNLAYLQLQNEVQRESREHNTLSNLLKVRHDSAKAAINNIR